MIDSRKKETLKEALTKYEAAHQIWFNTSVFDGNYPTVYENLNKARENYVKIHKRDHPDTIIF